MTRRGQNDQGRAGAPLRCPHCGVVLAISLLELDDEGRLETLLLFDCPRGDFHATATRDDMIAVMAAAVRAELDQL